MVFEDRPLEEYIALITGKAEDSPRRTFLFDTLFEECENLYDAISFFLAILEMAKQRLLRFHQEEMYGPIEIVVAEATEEEDESFLSEENAGDSPAEPPAP